MARTRSLFLRCSEGWMLRKGALAWLDILEISLGQ